jgi:hydroxyethylthiazole kinase-like uncharacterized protein yjeF
MRLVTGEEMQRAERECGVPIPDLMENAGLAAAQEAWLLLGEIAERRILVLAGPGNNGGDGLVAARHLKDWGADVIVALIKPRSDDDANFTQLTEREVPVIVLTEDAANGYQRLTEALGGAELVVDALLGTGRARPIEGDLAEVMRRLSEARASRLPPRLLAVDLPTGLDADTGAVDPLCVAADHTVTFAFSKIGLHVLPGSHYTGHVEVVDIGIPSDLAAGVTTELMDNRLAAGLLPDRPLEGHKGTFGSALIVAGSPHYVGAAYLACMGALRAGPGLVTLACAKSIHPILATKLTETTFEPLNDYEGALSAAEVHDVQRVIESGYEGLLVGPGLGQGGYQQAFMKALVPNLSTDHLKGVVIDADGLNNLAKVDGWHRSLNVPAVITPHPGELSRLTGLAVAETQRDRLAVAKKYATELNVTLVLKGANTVVAHPDGRVRLSPFANPALASGGTGDVLAGVITGLIAQGVDTFDAASLGVHLHARAAENVSRGIGNTGVIAGDLLPQLPRIINEMRGG